MWPNPQETEDLVTFTEEIFETFTEEIFVQSYIALFVETFSDSFK